MFVRKTPLYLWSLICHLNARHLFGNIVHVDANDGSLTQVRAFQFLDRWLDLVFLELNGPRHVIHLFLTLKSKCINAILKAD